MEESRSPHLMRVPTKIKEIGIDFSHLVCVWNVDRVVLIFTQAHIPASLCRLTVFRTSVSLPNWHEHKARLLVMIQAIDV
jgi:hypothetical protein